jgi:putative two-component system response regulator
MLDDLERGVPLHDIGKVAIPDYILLKKGKLSHEETAIMRKHAEAGAETIRSVRMQSPDFTMLEVAEQIARSHHEWFDGSGYPAGLSGQRIPLVARIVAVADAYDAITTRRPYKGPIPHETAVTLIQEASGTQFDPAIVEALVRVAAQFDLLRCENTDGDWQEADDAQTARALMVAGGAGISI